jgi:diguanylate cyclase (GGDEF)-like protein/PAS domain S-box-containing protein
LSAEEKDILNNLLNGVCVVDRARRIQYWNESALSITGYTAEDVVGKTCAKDVVAHTMGSESHCDALCPMLAGESSPVLTVDMRLRHRNGYTLPGKIRCVPLRDEADRVIGALEIFERTYVERDILNRLEDMGQKAYIDLLTGIPNRRYAEEALGDYLDIYEKRGRNLSVLLADVDFFKKVNDTWGHDTGDTVLRATAEALRASVRSVDLVSRWGGEEFLIILRDVNSRTLFERAEALRAQIDGRRMECGKNEVAVTMSFGGAAAKKGDSIESLVGRADACLYKSKRNGRNCVTVESDEE